jgi:N-methylhydantoinase A
MRSIGVDVGGTFTDFVAVDDAGRVAILKHLTTPADPSVAVLEGSRRLADEAAVAPADADRIVHGTTLVANSLIERRGARTALVTTAGFRDTLEIGRESRYDLYDLDLERPEPLVPRPLRLEVRERTRADGSILEQRDVEEAERVARQLHELGVESVAISLINAYANPAHERMLAGAIAREAPGVEVTLSSAVAPEWREYERTSTAAANAFVKPLVRRYLARLGRGFEELGAAGRLYVVLSQGGMTSAAVAAELAVQLIESGPAGGVMAASFFGRRLGLDDLISFDMGGTTTKVSLIEGGVPLQVPELEVARVARFKRGSGLPLKIPAIELVEIGAGGGSLGRIDALGLLKVGPQSAGADPGPACYGRGGEEPTVTDADLVLGLLDPDYFLGGAMSLDRERADGALARLGARIGLDAEACARGIFDIVNGQMALALQTHVVERGEDPRRFALVAFGGAGPVHAYEVARRLGIGRIVCPPAAGVASAVGFLVSPFAADLVRTQPGRLGGMDWDAVADRYREMEAQARDLLARAGASLDNVALQRSVDMRYAGQGYTVPVALPKGPLAEPLEAALRSAFDLAYERRFGSHLETAPVEALHWRLSAQAPLERPELAFAQPSDGDAAKGKREAYFPEIGGFAESRVYDRYRIFAGLRIAGPALIEERESTIVVGPSAAVEADDFGNLLITMNGR